MKKFNQLAKKKKLLKMFLCSIKTKVAIKFPTFFFFLSKIGLALKELTLTFVFALKWPHHFIKCLKK